LGVVWYNVAMEKYELLIERITGGAFQFFAGMVLFLCVMCVVGLLGSLAGMFHEMFGKNGYITTTLAVLMFGCCWGLGGLARRSL
jgi:hypothetical protein